MGKEVIEGIVTVVLSITGIGIIATLVSRNANTAGILSAGGTALATSITAAESPVLSSNSSISGLSMGWTGNAPADYGSF